MQQFDVLVLTALLTIVALGIISATGVRTPLRSARTCWPRPSSWGCVWIRQ